MRRRINRAALAFAVLLIAAVAAPSALAETYVVLYKGGASSDRAARLDPTLRRDGRRELPRDRRRRRELGLADVHAGDAGRGRDRERRGLQGCRKGRGARGLAGRPAELAGDAGQPRRRCSGTCDRSMRSRRTRSPAGARPWSSATSTRASTRTTPTWSRTSTSREERVVRRRRRRTRAPRLGTTQRPRHPHRRHDRRSVERDRDHRRRAEGQGRRNQGRRTTTATSSCTWSCARSCGRARTRST